MEQQVSLLLCLISGFYNKTGYSVKTNLYIDIIKEGEQNENSQT